MAGDRTARDSARYRASRVCVGVGVRGATVGGATPARREWVVDHPDEPYTMGIAPHGWRDVVGRMVGSSDPKRMCRS